MLALRCGNCEHYEELSSNYGRCLKDGTLIEASCIVIPFCFEENKELSEIVAEREKDIPNRNLCAGCKYRHKIIKKRYCSLHNAYHVLENCKDYHG